MSFGTETCDGPRSSVNFQPIAKCPEIVIAARAYWKGSLKLSLVTCPVMLYPATTSAANRFHMINKETGNRLKQQMVDAETGEVVEDSTPMKCATRRT